MATACARAWALAAALVAAPLAVAVLPGSAGAASAQPVAPHSVSGPITHPGADHMGSTIRAHEPTGFAPRGMALASAAASTGPQGMDVSGHQGNVDWAAAAAAGAQFVYVKATEGVGYLNPYFSQQYNGSYDAGLIRGAYHFALPDRSNGTTQADYFVDHGGGWSPDGHTLPPMLDIEYNPYGPTCYGLSRTQMTGWIRDFSDTVHLRTGRSPVIYTTTDWWSTCTSSDPSFGTDTPLFIARYASTPGAMPAGWSQQTIWQYSDHGTLPGDQDVFNGSSDALRRFAVSTLLPAPPPAPAPVPVTGWSAQTGEDLGGLIAGAPATASQGSGRIDLITRGQNTHRLYYAYSVNGSWSAWRNIGKQRFTADPALVSPAPGRLDVFDRGTDGALWQQTYTAGTWHGWHRLGGKLIGGPAATSQHRNEIDVFIRGTTNALYQMTYDHGRWSRFYRRNGNLTSPPTAVSTTDGTLDVLAAGPNNALTHASWTTAGGWRPWQTLSATATSGPAALTDAPGHLDIYTRTTGNTLTHRWYAAGAWSSWQNLGGTLASRPAVLTPSTGRIEVFYRDPARHTRHRWYEAG